MTHTIQASKHNVCSRFSYSRVGRHKEARWSWNKLTACLVWWWWHTDWCEIHPVLFSSDLNFTLSAASELYFILNVGVNTFFPQVSTGTQAAELDTYHGTIFFKCYFFNLKLSVFCKYSTLLFIILWGVFKKFGAIQRIRPLGQNCFFSFST